MLTPKEAYELASQWGSFVSSADEGMTFYSFYLNDGRPLSEQHREACIHYLADGPMRICIDGLAAACRLGVAKKWKEHARDLVALGELMEFFMKTGLRPTSGDGTQETGGPHYAS